MTTNFQEWNQEQDLGSAYAHATCVDDTFSLTIKDVSIFKFKISKMAYRRKLEELVNFTNYFIAEYDTAQEFAYSLQRVGLKIHETKNLTLAEFVGYLFMTVFTPSIKTKIVDVASNLSAEERDLKIAATAIRLVIPVMSEYVSVNELRMKSTMFKIIEPVFELFEETKRIPSIIRKLVNARLKDSHTKNIKMYEVQGLNLEETRDHIYRMVLTDAIFKTTDYTSISTIIDSQIVFNLNSQ